MKLHLVNREGQPVTVLINDLALADRPQEVLSFQVQPVGSPSPLKRALQGLVEHLLPSARDYLALLQMTPLLGGRYEKIKKLGQGNFGEVWLVVDTEALGPERRFVAKIPFLKAANAKFRKEAAICQKLDPHPGVARLIDTLEDDGKLVMIQEYVEGMTLGDMLDQELPRPLVERIILQLIEVVAHAHKNRIMHRDIKPNNIIIQPNGNLKLLDFGAAKMLGEKEISATMVGSRPFMAPEQIMGQSERRSDIWAIGVLMYLLYTGELPFYSEVEKLLIDQILEQEPCRPGRRTRRFPRPWRPLSSSVSRKSWKSATPAPWPSGATSCANFPTTAPRPGGGRGSTDPPGHRGHLLPTAAGAVPVVGRGGRGHLRPPAGRGLLLHLLGPPGLYPPSSGVHPLPGGPAALRPGRGAPGPVPGRAPLVQAPVHPGAGGPGARTCSWTWPPPTAPKCSAPFPGGVFPWTGFLSSTPILPPCWWPGP